MPFTPSGIYWESIGDQNDSAVVLIEGYTGQLIGWRDEFCEMLVSERMRVIRVDNRDIGRSRHEPAGTEYTLGDMAGDVAEVITDSGAGRATVVGQSMGGMIAQHLALDHPDLVEAAVLFYTTPSLAPLATDALQPRFVPPASRDEAVELFIAGYRAAASPGFPYDEERQRALAGRMYDRDPDQSGIPRQRAAISRLGDLRVRLGELTMPVALVHGRDDALISPRGSLEILRHVAHAELHLYSGMGHEIVTPLWSEFVSIITRAARAGRDAHAGR